MNMNGLYQKEKVDFLAKMNTDRLSSIMKSNNDVNSGSSLCFLGSGIFLLLHHALHAKKKDAIMSLI